MLSFRVCVIVNRGHGVYIQDGKMIASVCGIVERVNKLISIRPLKSRYYAKIGDVVVGRVVNVGSSFSRSDCSFLLAPGTSISRPIRMPV